MSDLLVGTEPSTPHHAYADLIFTKFLCHAMSLRKLTPDAASFQAEELWDMPSACTLARCVVEAYVVLEYIALSEITNDEMSFRLLVWRLHDLQRRSNLLQSIGSTTPEALSIYSNAAELQDEVESHPRFTELGANHQKKIREGDAPSFLISQRSLNGIIGISHEHWLSTTMWLSQYVHTLPMSIHQLQDFKAGTPQALHLSAMPIQYSLPYLARGIKRMADVFPAGNVELTEHDFMMMARWISVAERGVGNWESNAGNQD